MRGADWFVRNAVDKGAFTGVCGDARFINDFATGQAVQALLDMHGLTGEARYRDAALRTARMYATSIYTHPTPGDREIEYKGRKMQEWQISQVGLCFEHGGCAGSAVKSGPILLTSHCGMFVRLYEETADRLFLDLARAAATAREAHLAPDTHMATYYWSQFDRGPGPFPHHAWWQLGWIADYVFAEAEMRSGRRISFPRGFMTPKVGPQRIFGFEPGTVYGEQANPIMVKGLFDADNTDIEILSALTTDPEQALPDPDEQHAPEAACDADGASRGHSRQAHRHRFGRRSRNRTQNHARRRRSVRHHPAGLRNTNPETRPRTMTRAGRILLIILPRRERAARRRRRNSG